MESSMDPFPGVALVTGAAGTGIGNAVAKAFVRAGCRRIAITDINNDALQETAASIRAYPAVQVVQLAGDISSPDFVTAFHEAALAAFGRLDYCVNCAGIMGNAQPSIQCSVEDFDRINAVNYRGLWLCSRAQLTAMASQSPLSEDFPPTIRAGRHRGAIVNIASQLGLVGRPAAPAYSASKAAVIALTRADAIDYAARGIRVNCVCPGVIDTPMTTGDEETRARLEPAVRIAPMERMGLPEEVADPVLFLCGTGASFVQGHALVVDGGYVIN